MPRYFYALSDSRTGHYPKEWVRGLVNTKTAIAFSTKKERDTWLEDTRLLTARELSRAQALKLTEDVRCFENYVLLKTNYLGEEFGVELIKGGNNGLV